MAGFKQTDSASGHKHIVYLNEEIGLGICAPAPDGHVHQIQLQPPGAPETDDQGNVLAPGTPATWVFTPGEDGHTHTLEDVSVKIKNKKSKEDVASIWAEWKACKERESESLEQAARAKEFQAGNQWDDEDKQYLHGQSRAAQTINFAGKQIDELSGTERQQRSEFKLLPVEATDQRATDMYQALVKQVSNQCYYAYWKSAVFKDSLVTGRGWFNLWVDFSKNVLGDIKIERWNTQEIVTGPHDSPILEDCEILFKERWYSYDKLKSIYGKKAKDIEVDWDYMQLGVVDKKHQRYLKGDQYAQSDNWKPIGTTFGGHEVCDTLEKQYRVIERWKKIYEPVTLVCYPADGVFVQAFGWSDADIESVRNIEGALVIERTLEKMRITKVAGNVILSDENPADLPADTFFCVPVYAYKEGDLFWGKMGQLMDLQEGVNKSYSLSLDILNKCSSYASFYDNTIFPDNVKEQYKNNANQPGAIFEVNDVNRLPKRDEGVPFPDGVVRMLEMQQNAIQLIGNVSPEPPGANTSAQAILQRAKQLLKGNEELFDNLSLSQQVVGRLLLKVLRRYYTPERILRVLQQANADAALMVGDRTFDEWSEEEVLSILEKNDIDQYDIVVTEADSSPSAMLGTNLMLSDLASKGLPIPPQAIIETAPLPEKTKEKMLRWIEEQNQAQSQGNQVAADAEIKKTLIAQGYIPPDVQQQYLNPQPQSQQQGGPGVPTGGIGEGEPIPSVPGATPPPMPQQAPQQQMSVPPLQKMQPGPDGQPVPDLGDMGDMGMGQSPDVSGQSQESLPQLDSSALQAEMQNQQMQQAIEAMAQSIQQLAAILTKKEASGASPVVNNYIGGGTKVSDVVRDPMGKMAQVISRTVPDAPMTVPEEEPGAPESPMESASELPEEAMSE